MQNTQKHPTWFVNAASSCSDNMSNLRAAMVHAPPSNSAVSHKEPEITNQIMPRARTYFDNRIAVEQ